MYIHLLFCSTAKIGFSPQQKNIAWGYLGREC